MSNLVRFKAKKLITMNKKGDDVEVIPNRLNQTPRDILSVELDFIDFGLKGIRHSKERRLDNSHHILECDSIPVID
jgi:hypothetical protein